MNPDFVIEAARREGDVARLRVAVPTDLRFFDGHFEGRPMLPGIAQVLVLVHRRARDLLGPLGRERRIVRLKFERVIRPGDALEVELERIAGQSGEHQVRFRIARDGEICASGAIVYAA